ncbi:protein yellow-like [Ctenocephalides felis]|uniref:protein yellow-like n=1 Tax=Ctenocephalides felis TaxID=7515 RepID=UPI000E6E5736|nr:protein yellow-like [Ctenocephalides felis]
MARWQDKLFLTIPRWKSGVASTLAYIPLNETIGKTKTPELIPYPNLKYNTLPEIPKDYKCCDKKLYEDENLLSVFRIRVDECDRLWVLDAGSIDIIEQPIKLAKPALLIYDLNTDKLIRRYTFKDSDFNDNSFFAHMVLDPRSCNDTIAYISDPNGYGLVVYSFDADESWRIEHNYFHSDPLSGQYDVGGVQFFWPDGVFGVALSKVQDDGFRTAYFQPGASSKQFKVSTRVLSNASYANSFDAFHEFKLIGDRGPNAECTSSYMDEESGVVFYAEINKYSITCWNSAKPYIVSNLGLVDYDVEKLIFPDEIFIDSEKNVWILSNKMPQFLYKKLDPNEINYRILKVKVKDAISGTPCEEATT